MYRIDDNLNVAALPALPTDNVGSPGYFTGGNPSVSPPVPPTRVRFWWLNMIQEEIIAVIAAAGIALVKGANNQLLAALQALFMPRNVTTGAWSEVIYTSAANQSYTRSLTFTTPVPGIVHIHGGVNIGGSAQQPAISSHALYVDGVIGPADQTTSTMHHSYAVGVAAGTHTVSSLYQTGNATGTWLSIGQVLSYIFVPV